MLSRRSFLKKAGFTASALAVSPKISFSQQSEKKTNLLFIFSDQQRRMSMGFMNEDPVNTPNFDNFAAEGFAFTNCVTNFPLCSPYRDRKSVV